MTIAEMISLLEAMPDKSLRVVVNGYEGGYSDATELECFSLTLNVNTQSWYGPHERTDHLIDDTKASDYENVLAILVH